MATGGRHVPPLTARAHALLAALGKQALHVSPPGTSPRKPFSLLPGRQARPARQALTIIAFTISLLLFFRARTAFARDTLAWDITSSMSFTSTPVSST